jgi:hypothetical protein
VRRDARLVNDELELDKDQVPILETLLLDYETAFAEAAETMQGRLLELRPEFKESEEQRAQREALFEQMRQARREMREMRERMGDQVDPAAIEEMRARFEPIREKLEAMRPRLPEGEELQALTEQMTALAEEWQSRRRELRSEFMSGLKAILNEQQVDHWPKFEQTLRRQKSLPRGRFSGESVDLFLVLREMDLDESLRPEESIVETYAGELDQALKARDEHLEKERLNMFRSMAGGDVEAAVAIVTRESELRVGVRNVNERFVEAFADAMGAKGATDSANEFRGAYQQRAYERIFGPTRTQRAFDAARELEGLPEDALLAILSVEESYRAQMGELNQKLVQLTRTQEPVEAEQRLRRRAARQQGAEFQRPEDPLRDLFRERGRLNRQYREQLEGYLTPEQIAKLPSADPEREGRGGRGDFSGMDEERRARMLERFDRNGDGELNEEEMEAMRQARRQRRGGGPDDN